MVLYLKIELGGSSIQLRLVRSQLGKLDVNRCSDGCSQVSWAEGEVAKPVTTGKGYLLFNLSDSVDHAPVNAAQVTALLHGDDSQVIFFVHPDQECLVIIVVNTTSSWPVAACVRSLKETVSFLEEEVVINKLLLHFLTHASEWVIGTLQIAS